MSDTPTPQELLAQIEAFIEITRTHIRDGGEVDLAGLDSKVQELCEQVLDMPKAQADEYQRPLAELAAELTALKTTMADAQNDVQDQLNALNMRHKAAKAYKTREAAQPPKKKDE